MEKFKDLQYTISTPMSEATMKKNHGSGPCKNRLEAAADAINWFATKSFGFAQEKIFKKKLEEIYPHIIDKMKNYTGVLVIAQYQQWESQNAAGSNPLELLALRIGPAASNRQSAYRRFRQMERKHTLKQGPSPGMVYGPIKLVWITKILPDEKQQKLLKEKQKQRYWKPAP